MTKARDLANASTALSAVSATELGYVDGVTSAIQTQLDNKVDETGGSTITVASGTTVPLTIQNNGTGNSFVVNDVASDTSPVIINADGQLFVGTTTDLSLTGTGLIQVANTGSTQVQVGRFSDDTGGPVLSFGKSRGTTVPSQTVVQSGDSLGQIVWRGSDGTSSISGATITGEVDGTPGTTDMPTRLVIATTPDGAGAPVERMRITNAGNVGIGTASPNVNYKLDVNGAVLTNNKFTANLGGQFQLVDSTGNNSYYFKNDANVLTVVYNSAERMRIASDGAVSIPLVLNAQTASYTAVLADAGKLVEISNASANNFTVPLNSSVAYPIGTQINILQTGAGQTTVVATGGVTINATPGLKLRAQWSSATLIKRATDTWVLVGDLSA